MARPRKTPELKWLGGNEQTFVARFDGQRKRYGPDREEAVRRFEDDLAAWLAGQKTPARPAGGSLVPQVLTVPGLCVRHLEGFLPTVGRSQGEHHRRVCLLLGERYPDRAAGAFTLADLVAFRSWLMTRTVQIASGPANLLWEELQAGPRPSRELVELVLRAGHSEASYSRAKQVLGVRSRKVGRHWLLSLPAGVPRPGREEDVLSRSYVNKMVTIVQSIWRQGAVRGDVPAETASALSLLPQLRAEQGGRETAGRLPASAEDVERILARVREPWSTLIRLQFVTGMRPGEVCAFRWDRVTRAAGQPVQVQVANQTVPVQAVTVDGSVVWIYAPSAHKTRRKGKSRLVALGPKAQELLTPWLGCPGYTFGPNDGQRPRCVSQYSWTIRRLCRRLGIPAWTPHQLRHGYATHEAQTADLADLQAQLGHSSAAMTAHYVAQMVARAARMAR